MKSYGKTLVRRTSSTIHLAPTSRAFNIIGFSISSSLSITCGRKFILWRHPLSRHHTQNLWCNIFLPHCCDITLMNSLLRLESISLAHVLYKIVKNGKDTKRPQRFFSLTLMVFKGWFLSRCMLEKSKKSWSLFLEKIPLYSPLLVLPVLLIVAVGYSIVKNTILAKRYQPGSFWVPWHPSL